MRTNDYFLEFVFTPTGELYSSHVRKVEHAGIPEGYALFLYKEEVYIPVQEHRTRYSNGQVAVQYLTSSRGSGSNPEMDVPIHYVANPNGLRSALNFLKESAALPPSQAELAAERVRNLRVHILPDESHVVENESSERG